MHKLIIVSAIHPISFLVADLRDMRWYSVMTTTITRDGAGMETIEAFGPLVNTIGWLGSWSVF